MRSHRFTVIIIALIMIITTFASCGGQSSGKVTAPALFSKVTRYEIDYQTGEWYKKEVTDYEYENAYPVSIKSYDYDAEGGQTWIFKYTFKDDKPYVMKRYNEEGKHDLTVSYTKKGLRNREHYYYELSTRELIYQYGNRDQYFTMVHHETLGYLPEDPDGPKDHAEEVDSIIITSSDGLLVKTVNDGIYANWGDGEPKEWCRFFGSYTAEYDENGIASKTSAIFNTIGGSGDQEKYEITVSEGRVTEAVKYRWNSGDDGSEGEWAAQTRYEFEYTDIEISADRYATMINDIIMEGGTTYYIFNWY